MKWFQPTSLLELTSCFARNPDARLVSGCTSEEFRPDQPGFLKCSVIQISRLKELHSFEVYDNHVCIGAGLTVTEIDKHLTETVSKLPGLYIDYCLMMIAPFRFNFFCFCLQKLFN